MENNICKALLLNRQIRAVCINSTRIVDRLIQIHGLTPVCAAALGRTVSATALLASGLKNPEDSITVTIRGDGAAGAIVTACDGSLKTLRGYVDNPRVTLPLSSDGKLDVGGAVGANGNLTVIKDIGLKKPYVGRTALVSGEIAEDFTRYLAESEQQPSIVSLGVLIAPDGSCKSAGGIILDLLPGYSEQALAAAEQAAVKLADISRVIEGLSPEQYIDLTLEYLGAEIIGGANAELNCKCGDGAIERAVLALGEEDAFLLLKERGKVSIRCHFCAKEYVFGAKKLKELFDRARGGA